MEQSCPRCQDGKLVELTLRNCLLCPSCEYIYENSVGLATYSLATPLRIFLSYGHDKYQKLVMHVKDVLQSRGHSVWCDTEQLSAGCDWETGIAEGLNWAKEANDDGRMLLFITPHALRRPDGYCLNEIARALTLKLNIFPVLVCETDPPAALHSHPFFDMRDCVPEKSSEDEWDYDFIQILQGKCFFDKLNRLLAIVELCKTMSDYAVLPLAGALNLGVMTVDSEDTKKHKGIQRLKIRPSSAREVRVASIEDIPVNVEISGRFLFSYDPSCAELAQMLHVDLGDRGCSIFPLCEGADEDYINEGIKWCCEEPDAKLVLFVTSASVGRPNGTSLNHIAAAMNAGMGFVPLMIRRCEMPLSICRIQWFDMVDCLGPDSVNKARYTPRVNQLASVLAEGLDHDGQQARLFSLMAPFSFQSQIAKHTIDFTGRDWLFQDIEQWLNDPSASQLYWITAQIGAGKTAAACKLIQTRPEIAAFHLASRVDEQTQNSRRCVLSLIYQLMTQLPDYAAAIQSGDPLEEIIPVSTVKGLVETLILNPLNAISGREKPMAILVDAIEKIGVGPDSESLASMVPSMISRFPTWLRLIILSREDLYVMECLQSFEPRICFDKRPQESMRDLQLFLNKKLLKNYQTEVQSSYDKAPEPTEIDPSILGLIIDNAECLFLYAEHIIEAVVSGRMRLLGLETCPVGMGGFLMDYFESHYTEEVYKETIRPALEVLCAAYEPLQLSLLSSILGYRAYERVSIVKQFGSLFSVDEDDMIKPFHTSVYEWLQNFKSSGQYFVDVYEGHRKIGFWGWEEYQRAVTEDHDFSKLNFELEKSDNESIDSTHRAHMYIVRHAYNHLQEPGDEESIRRVGYFAKDEKFQLARRLLGLREKGLGSFFHGNIGRLESQMFLSTRPEVGSFLIRYSERQKSYCTSFISGLNELGPKFTHNLIFHLDCGAYSVVPQSKIVDGVTIIYPDLTSFVEAFQRKGILTTPIPRNSPLNREISQP